MNDPFSSPDNYSIFIHRLPDRYPSIKHSTLRYISLGIKVGKVMGMIVFSNDVVLCIQEFLNFELQAIEGYGYEVSQSGILPDNLPPAEEYCRASFTDKEKLWWYDSFPHPNDKSLASSHPHHKHILPDIKHHRIPAPDLTFTKPNLPFLIEEVISDLSL